MTPDAIDSPGRAPRQLSLRALLLSTSGLVATQAVSAVLSLAASAIIARILTPAEFGQYTYATATAILLSVLLDVRAFQWINALDAARGVAPAALAARVRHWTRLSVALGVVTGAVGMWSGWIDDPWAVALLAPAVALHAQMQACYLGLEDFLRYSRQTVGKLVLILGTAPTALLLDPGTRLTGLLALFAAAHLLPAWWAMRNLARHAPADGKAPDHSSNDLRRRAWLVNTASIAATRVELVMTRRVLPPEDLGIYAVVFVITDLFGRAAGSLATVMFPWIVQQGDDPSRHRGAATVLLLALGAVFAGGIALLLIGAPIMRLAFGSEYVSAWRLVMLHMPGMLLFSALNVINNVVAAEGYPHAQWVASVLALATKAAVLLSTAAALGLDATALAYGFGPMVGILFLVLTTVSGRAVVDALPDATIRLLGLVRRTLRP